MGTTYYELGQRLGVDICVGCPFGTEQEHRTGFWLWDGKFHYAERAMRRTSLRNFVWKLSAQTTLTDAVEPSWLRYWHRVEWAKDSLRTLQIRLPASAWDTQRVTLRALLAVPHAGAGVFFDDPHLEAREVTRSAAVRWAKRPVDPGDGSD